MIITIEADDIYRLIREMLNWFHSTETESVN